MDNDQLKTLLKKYKGGECTEEEVWLVESWYNSESAIKSDKVSLEHLSQANANIWGKVIASVDLPRVVSFKNEHNDISVKEEDNGIRIKEDNDIAAKVSKIDVDDNKMVSTRLWPRVLRIRGIAAAVAAITLGVWLYYASGLFGGRHRDHEVAAKQIFSGSNDVAPGKNTATLTLANGKTINLSDTKTGVIINASSLKYSDGSTVVNLSPSGRDGVAREGNNNNPISLQGGSLLEGERSKVQMLTASTPRGGQYTVILPDGTKVWLNAASSLKFPSSFSATGNRKVELTGEAYFEVYKDKKKPFLVNTGKQQVQVLGTHFNINAYSDAQYIKTTLLEGSVKVGIMHDDAIDNRTGLLKPGVGTIIEPGQQAQVLYGLPIKLIQANLEEAMAWKNGMFIFNDENIESVMKKIARWYDVEVIYEGQISKEGFNGMISRDKNISQVLLALEKTKGVHFKIKGRRVIVTE